MSKMKDRMIDQMNFDWEAMHDRERAMIDAERMMEEEMLWLELQNEDQELEKAKIIQDDRHEENEETPGHWYGPEFSNTTDLHSGQDRHEGAARISVDRETDESPVQERNDSAH